MAVAPDLEALVREALREPVAELVRRLVPELVAEQLNGRGDLAALAAAAAPQTAVEAPPAPGGYPRQGGKRCGAQALLGLRAAEAARRVFHTVAASA